MLMLPFFYYGIADSCSDVSYALFISLFSFLFCSFLINVLSTKDTCTDVFIDSLLSFTYLPFTLLYPFLFKFLLYVCGFTPKVEAISSKEMPLSCSLKNSSIL